MASTPSRNIAFLASALLAEQWQELSAHPYVRQAYIAQHRNTNRLRVLPEAFIPVQRSQRNGGRMKPARWDVVILGGLLCCASPSPGEQSHATQLRELTIAPETKVRAPERWKASGVAYANAQELIVPGHATIPGEAPGQSQVVEYPLARILITTEKRTSHEDALKRLQDIAASRTVPARFVEIGGWPAVELDFTEPLPRRGQATQTPAEVVARSIIAIASESTLTSFDISFAPDAPAALQAEAKQIARSSSFPKRGDPEAVRKSLQALERAAKRVDPKGP
jgi:hypothetical protein